MKEARLGSDDRITRIDTGKCRVQLQWKSILSPKDIMSERWYCAWMLVSRIDERARSYEPTGEDSVTCSLGFDL